MKYWGSALIGAGVFSLVVIGCASPNEWYVPVDYENTLNGDHFRCETLRIEWDKSREWERVGMCWNAGEVKLFNAAPPYARVVKTLVPVRTERNWMMGEKFDSLIGRLESMVERWLEEFDHSPIKTGTKVLVTFIVLRFIYRKILR